jgi:hypothetical protein
VLALAACNGEEPWPPPLFDCEGNGDRYVLRDLNNGELVLEIEDPPTGNVGMSTWISSWTDIRSGSVVGQQGGHQSHLRLFDGKQHFVLYEGENGVLSDTAGATHAGVAVLDESSNGEPLVVADCEASPTNRALLDNVRKARAAAGVPQLVEEEVGGPFDQWY